MSRKDHSSLKRCMLAAALALAASDVAFADDTSTGRFGGDGYAYFNQPMRSSTASAATWRQTHPNGVSNRDLQAASSSSLAAAAAQFDNASSAASASADPSWRQSHPNGLTNRELQAAGASALSTWQLPDEVQVGRGQNNVAQAASKATSPAPK